MSCAVNCIHGGPAANCAVECGNCGDRCSCHDHGDDSARCLWCSCESWVEPPRWKVRGLPEDVLEDGL